MDDLVVSKLDTLLAQVADLSEYLKTHLGDKRSIRPVPRLAVRLSPEQVRAARTVLQMDQQSFAEVLGIHHASTVSRWERRNGACKINKVYSNTILTLVREKLTELQSLLRDRTRAAVTLGIGPRYLHSTGQLHKGGPNNGLFLMITSQVAEGLPIPGEKFSFADLELAQAIGDLEALEAKGRRAFHVRLDSPTPEALETLIAEMRKN